MWLIFFNIWDEWLLFYWIMFNSSLPCWHCRIADAEENLGESEVREAHLAKSLYYIQIGEKVLEL